LATIGKTADQSAICKRLQNAPFGKCSAFPSVANGLLLNNLKGTFKINYKIKKASGDFKAL
jgi:hypothetical protein